MNLGVGCKSFTAYSYTIMQYLLCLERKPLETLALEKKLTAYKHNGFWHPMDTLRDKNYLENLWKNNKAEWKIW